MSSEFQLKRMAESRKNPPCDSAKMLYGYGIIRPEQCAKLYVLPITLADRCRALWNTTKFWAIQILLIAAMFVCFSYSFAMIFRMINA